MICLKNIQNNSAACAKAGREFRIAFTHNFIHRKCAQLHQQILLQALKHLVRTLRMR